MRFYPLLEQPRALEYVLDLGATSNEQRATNNEQRAMSDPSLTEHFQPLFRPCNWPTLETKSHPPNIDHRALLKNPFEKALIDCLSNAPRTINIAPVMELDNFISQNTCGQPAYTGLERKIVGGGSGKS